MQRKYEFTGETKFAPDKMTTLYRIKAIRDFGEVKAGDFGGWLEDEENLSHEGNAWVADEAMVCYDARVYEDA